MRPFFSFRIVQGRWSSVKKDFYDGSFRKGRRNGYGIYRCASLPDMK
jgi:hypothetical protein